MTETMPPKNIRAALVGVTGYTGMELTRLLAAHPHIRLTAATSRTECGKTLGELYPFIQGLPSSEIRIVEPDADRLAEMCELAFLAVPHGTAAPMAAMLLEKGLKVIDLSADFRITDPETYATWYNITHPYPELLSTAVYGLPELHGESIKNASLIANPGCYPTSVILALAPLLQYRLLQLDDILIDSKSGVTGAGRKASISGLFCETSDSFRAYGLGGTHRHTPEIEQLLGMLAGESLHVSFNPHLLPINRGILSTIYTRLKKPMHNREIHDCMVQYWKENGSPWVRVLPLGHLPETRNVRGTMFCDIGLTLDSRTQRLTLVSVIDNLCRGASGQAVANANIMYNLPQTVGLMQAPLLP